jgi:hypothetical protein
LPSTSEENRVDMPDHRSSYEAASGQLRPQSHGQLPPRPKSAAPYPEEDLPLPGQLPYPGQGLRPHSQAGPSADRPSSAFGIRPLTHAATETQYDHRNSLTAEPLRPTSTTGSMPVSGGRGSNPAERGRVVSSGWEPQLPGKYREPSPNRLPTLPQVDVGRPMNFEQGTNRLQKLLPPITNKPYPSLPNTQPYPQTPQTSQPYPPSSPASQLPYNQGYGASTSQRPPQQEYSQVLPRRDPNGNQFTRSERGSSMTPVGIQTGTHVASPVMNQPAGRFDSVHGQVQNTSRASNRPTTALSSQSGDSRHSSIAPSTASSGPAAPPKKTGPATFEEMGIPKAKAEGDCVSNSVNISNLHHTDIFLDRYVVLLSSK